MASDFDPTVALDCETVDDDMFVETRAMRASVVAGMPNTDNRDRSFKRQKKNICDLLDKVEKFTRIVSRYETDQAQDNATKRFSVANKEARLKDLRIMWNELKRQDDFISVAKEHGYEVAERMAEMEGSGQISDGRKKLLAEILRDNKGKELNKGKSQRKYSPYNMRQQQTAPAVSWTGQAPGYQAQPPYFGGPVYHQPGQATQAGYGFGMPGHLPFQPTRMPTSKFVKKIDKSDPACPFMMQPPRNVSNQPMPPGTEN